LGVDCELIEQRLKIDAAPPDIGHAPLRLLRLQRIADALMHRLHHRLGTRLKVVETEDLYAADQPVDGQRPLRRIDARNAEMGKDEEIFRRGQRIPCFVRAQRQALKAAGGFHRRPLWGGMGERCAGHGNRDFHRVGRSSSCWSVQRNSQPFAALPSRRVFRYRGRLPRHDLCSPRCGGAGA
jgi:hypothetical protein